MLIFGGIAKTIAIVGGGFKSALIGNKLKIANKIIENGGLILSEYMPSMPSLSHQFLERNRIISALSDIVIIIEAPIKSGAMNTAKHALEQNKKIYAIPWNLNYYKGEGNNYLLMHGATSLINYKQILFELNKVNSQITFEEYLNNNTFSKNKEQKNIPNEFKGYFDYIYKNSPVSIEEILTFFNDKSISEINSSLTMMEIEDLIIKDGNNYSIKL